VTDDWQRHPAGRWVVGDPGRQSQVQARPATTAQSRPDTTIDGASVGYITYRAVSLRGLSHWSEGKPRQDAYLLRVTNDGQWLVGCVADGVSKSPYSHMAADIACRETTKCIAKALDGQPPIADSETWPKLADELPWQQAVDEANAAMVAKAGTGLPAEQHESLTVAQVRGAMATTAVVFAVAATPAGDGRLPFALVVAAGDSSALVLSQGRWYPVTAVKNAGSDMASNAVLALPREVEVAPHVSFLRPGDALAVVTDGIGDPMGSGAGEVGRFLAARWSRPPDLLAFAGHAAFYRRGFADDRTAAVVWYAPATQEAPEAGETTETREPSELRPDGARTPAPVAHRQPPENDPLEVAFTWCGEEGSSD
jgi:hypothetical protein